MTVTDGSLTLLEATARSCYAPHGDVAVTTRGLPPGTRVRTEICGLDVALDVPHCRNFAVRASQEGGAGHKHCESIGRATANLPSGEHMCSHNLGVDASERSHVASILAETPEVFGAEHLLTRQAVSDAVGNELLDRNEWWQEFAGTGGGTLDNNPARDDRTNELTTILEKFLGAVPQGGRACLTAVYEYAKPVTERGFVFMDTPGYDPMFVTGIVAGGTNIARLTTDLGSVLGCRPTRSIESAANTEMFDQVAKDMEIICGRIIEGTASLTDVGDQISERIIAMTSGQRTVSEDSIPSKTSSSHASPGR